jgi:hypothetical protein
MQAFIVQKRKCGVQRWERSKTNPKKKKKKKIRLDKRCIGPRFLVG